MFGMGDMAMGSAMQMNGMMDMSQGMMLTEMGMPGLGAVDMGIGAMEMGMGAGMMNMGMMENMYGGYGMGYGMGGGMGYGMGGMMAMDTALMMGCMGVGCTLACCNPGMYRRGCIGMGCTLPCCMPRRRFGNCRGYGCTGPCCMTTTTEVIILDGNNGRAQYQYPQQQQYQNQNTGYQYQNRQPQYQQNQAQYQQQYQPQQYQQQQPQQYPVQNQQYQNNLQPSNNPNQNPTYRANQPQPLQVPIQPQKQTLQPTSNPTQPLNPYPKPPSYKQSQPLNNETSQRQFSNYNINKSLANDDNTFQQYKNDCFPYERQQQRQQDYRKQNEYENDQAYFNQNVIYQGHLMKRHGFNWTEHPSAVLSRTHLIDLPITHMTKIKVKTDVAHQNCCFMKVTTYNTEDHFFGCYRQQQCDWFSSVIWAKMAMIGKVTQRYPEFYVGIEGLILRKSQYLGTWDQRFVRINASGLKSYRNPHSMPTLSLPTIKELWCRFEYLNGGRYIVVKCKSGGTKYEYGIPVESALTWIKAFYSILV